MAFGAKVKDAPSNMVSGGGDGNNRWIKYFGKGETTVHFLEELSEWTVYYEHFHQSKQRSFPCTGDRGSCPGCTSENEKESRASKRYLVNCLKDGYVDLYKIPTSCWDDLNRFADKDGGTILARDYTIVRYEKDNGTGYSVDREDKVEVNPRLHAENMQDHQEALLAAYEEVWGKIDPSGAEEPQVKPKRTAKKVAPKVEPLDYEENEDNPPSEPEAPADEDEAAQEDVEITEDQLRAMSQEELLRFYDLCGVEVPDTEDMKVLQDSLIAALS